MTTLVSHKLRLVHTIPVDTFTKIGLCKHFVKNIVCVLKLVLNS